MSMFQRAIKQGFHILIILSISSQCFVKYSYLLTCEKSSENEFSCNSVCDSVWYKYVDEADNIKIKEQCGKKFHNKYRNVMYLFMFIFDS